MKLWITRIFSNYQYVIKNRYKSIVFSFNKRKHYTKKKKKQKRLLNGLLSDYFEGKIAWILDIKNPCNLERSQGTPLGGR